MKVLITGNMGYVGPRVVAHLRARWPEAVLIGADTGWFAPLLTTANPDPESLLNEQWRCDVRDLDDASLRGVDAVVHLAGISNDPIGIAYEAPTLDINLRGTLQLAARARAAGVRAFVFASSCSIYGESEEGARNEQSAPAPLTAYARSKVLAEEGLASLATSEFLVTSLRFATACGMSERLRLDLMLNDFVAGAVAARRIRILSDGTPWRPLIDVNDMARAVEWAILREREHGRNLIINAGRTEANYRVHEVADAVADQIEGTSVTVDPAGRPDRRSYRVDFSLFARLAPEHQPVVTLRESIAGLREGLMKMGYTTPDVRDSPYIRLRTLSELKGQGAVDGDLRWTRVAAGA
ncbi:MAG: SDR family oxidoreductase [Acidobacteriota bacterium]